MKKIFTAIVFAVALSAASPSQAQVKFGLKGGLNVTSMSLSSDVVKKDNQNGFFVGPTIKVSVPLVGLAVDGAVLYDQRGAELGEGTETEKVTQKSVVVPINLRYGIGLGSIASVYAAVGPQFGFNVGDEDFKWNDTSSYSLKKSNFSINVGAGVSLMSHLEIGVTYNIACGKTGEVTILSTAGDAVEQVSKTRSNAWQVSAAYYF